MVGRCIRALPGSSHKESITPRTSARFALDHDPERVVDRTYIIYIVADRGIAGPRTGRISGASASSLGLRPRGTSSPGLMAASTLVAGGSCNGRGVDQRSRSTTTAMKSDDPTRAPASKTTCAGGRGPAVGG